jgi:hypothetical protein
VEIDLWKISFVEREMSFQEKLRKVLAVGQEKFNMKFVEVGQLKH